MINTPGAVSSLLAKRGKPFRGCCPGQRGVSQRGRATRRSHAAGGVAPAGGGGGEEKEENSRNHCFYFEKAGRGKEKGEENRKKSRNHCLFLEKANPKKPTKPGGKEISMIKRYRRRGGSEK